MIKQIEMDKTELEDIETLRRRVFRALKIPDAIYEEIQRLDSADE